MKENHKNFTSDPSTRYRSVPKKIEHDRILELYDTDSTEELDFLKEKFVKKQYYAKYVKNGAKPSEPRLTYDFGHLIQLTYFFVCFREEHKTLLNRLRKGFSRSISKPISRQTSRMLSQVRAVQSFRRQASAPATTTTSATTEKQPESTQFLEVPATT